MPEYTREQTLRIAKRFQNRKRAYLLVNPLQGKHLPVSPSRALAMMDALGDRLAAAYPDARLVIGFAETATAIGAAAAGRLGPDCRYIHTTREAFSPGETWIEFLEEHSHAAEQKLNGDRLAEWFAAPGPVILVDDEISTGKTLLNMVDQLRARYPALAGKEIVAASILNRVAPEQQRRMEQAGVRSVALVKLPQEDYTALVEPIQVREAEAVTPLSADFCSMQLACGGLKDPRLGLPLGEYARSCMDMAEAFLARLAGQFRPGSRVLVLGTEECMYPALILGTGLERRRGDCRVLCHATTRSPIGVSGEVGYPIRSGGRLPSFYQPERTTYIYNVDRYDGVIVVSDTPAEGTQALRALLAAFPLGRDARIFYIQGGRNVWYL